MRPPNASRNFVSFFDFGLGPEFDVPVAGAATIPVMRETGTTLLAVDAGRTLLLDRDEMLRAADDAGLCIVGCQPEED